MPSQSAKDESKEFSSSLDKAQAEQILKDPRFGAPTGWQWGQFKNADSARIRYGFSLAEKPIGTVVILPGFTEFGEVYFETIREFLAKNYSVYEIDWRGAGGSDRMIKDPDRASSLGFDHDVEDLDQFLNTIVLKQSKKPVFLVAHSMGSHIALRFLHDHPGIVTKAVLSAPPFDAPGTSAPPWMVSCYSWYQWRSKKGGDFVDGQGTWATMAPKISKMYTHSHDPVRVRLEEAWATVNPRLQSGGATWKWLYLFQQSCDVLNDPKFTSEIRTPMLLGCALSDHIANPDHEKHVAQSMPSCQVYEGIDARHDLFLEDDKHRIPWMQAIFKFLDNGTAPNK